jgi:ribosomal protein L1
MSNKLKETKLKAEHIIQNREIYTFSEDEGIKLYFDIVAEGCDKLQARLFNESIETKYAISFLCGNKKLTNTIVLPSKTNTSIDIALLSDSEVLDSWNEHYIKKKLPIEIVIDNNKYTTTKSIKQIISEIKRK